MSSACLTDVRQEKEIEIDKEIEGEEKNRKHSPTLYGEFHNVRLNEEEYQKLKEKLKYHTDTMIEKLSRYIKSSGKDYKDHYVTILNWYEQDREKLSQKDKSKNEIPNYDDSPTI